MRVPELREAKPATLWPLTIERVEPTQSVDSAGPTAVEFAGIVREFDIAGETSAHDVDAIETGMNRFGVLVIPGQPVTDGQQLAFSRHFGPLLEGANTTVRRDQLRLDPAFADVSNVDQEGRLLTADDRRRLASLGNRLWHSDASFRTIPARFSFLSARTIPKEGGNTEFADMRAAYDALDSHTQSRIENLVCEHSQLYSRARLGFANFTEDERERMKPVLHRLVRVHPQTGRKSLYLSAHIGAIVVWLRPEALAFIGDLTEHATQRRFVYSHTWQRDDLVIWDNRCTMHRVRSFDDVKERRDMRRTTTRAEAATVPQ